MSQEQPFRRRTVFWLVGLSVVSFGVSIGVAIFDEGPGFGGSTHSDAYSRSALGHRAFVELLGELDIPVLVSRYESSDRAGEEAVLVVAEPVLRGGADLRLSQMLRYRDGPTLLVLPKWRGLGSYETPDWIDDAELRDRDEAQALLEYAGLHRPVVRFEGTTAALGDWTGRVGFNHSPALHSPQLLAKGDFAEASPLVPLLACEAGVLIGRTTSIYGTPLIVVSDPDIMSTHGLDDGDNAVLAVAAIEHLRSGSQTVVFDETLHGHERRPTIWRELFDFPLVLVLMQGAVLAVFALWLAIRRFGAPEPAPPAIEPGKAFLIENTAELLRTGGHASHTLRRYYFNTLQDVGRMLNAPSDMNSQEQRAWLTDVAKRRGVEIDIARLARSVDDVSQLTGRNQATVCVRLAQRLHQWRREMVHGPGGDSRA